MTSLRSDSKPLTSFSKDQQILLKEIQTWVKNNNRATKIAISCKERDQSNSGQLNQKQLPDILKENKLEQSQQELIALKSCLRFDNKGEFKI